MEEKIGGNIYYGILLDNLYDAGKTEKTNAMWLASPSGYGSDRVMCAGYAGRSYYEQTNAVFNTTYSWPYEGIRPLICLKSEVLLEKIEEGRYTIKE